MEVKNWVPVLSYAYKRKYGTYIVTIECLKD